MDFVSNQDKQIRAMLDSLGINSVDELFHDIPTELKVPPIQENDGLAEIEGMRLMEEIASKNTYPTLTSYLGAGAYEHHVPALVPAVCAKSEFLTSYTPYQAEASQGMLQAIFEFQSAICALTGLDVANASLYDGATACAEAMLMALRLKKERNKIVVAETLHPHYLSVIKQFLEAHGTEIDLIPMQEDGTLDSAAAEKKIDDKTAAVLLPYPNFFGVIDDLVPVIAWAKEQEALTVITANPLVYGIYASAAELGADIAIGDGQPFGLPLQFGGPYVGYMACRQELVRQMPGRIVGETVDQEGRRGFVLTLQAREQHIRREKATSNICTNQALAALACLVSILWYGKEGVQKLALTNFQRASYLKSNLSSIPGIKVMGTAPFFNEFAVSFNAPVDKVVNHFRAHNIEPGLDLGKYFPKYRGYFLVAVTETKNKNMLDKYLKVAATFHGGHDDNDYL